MANRVRFYGNVRSAPQWMADYGNGPQVSVAMPAKIDPSQFNDGNAIQLVVASGGAAGNATSIPIGAASLPNNPATILIEGAQFLIPNGTALYFGASKKLALLTATVNIGDTALTVQALPTALVQGDTAYYSANQEKTIPSGMILGRTSAERDSNVPFGAAVSTDDEIYVQLFDIPNANDPGGDDVEVYRHGLTLKENYLPNYTALSTAVNEVQNVAIAGTASAGSFKLGFATPSGGRVFTDPIAWNATYATIITSINTAITDAIGSADIVAADSGTGTAANPNFNLTYSGTGYTLLPWGLVEVDTGALTGATIPTVTRVTAGGTALLSTLRKLYTCIKGVD